MGQLAHRGQVGVGQQAGLDHPALVQALPGLEPGGLDDVFGGAAGQHHGLQRREARQRFAEGFAEADHVGRMRAGHVQRERVRAQARAPVRQAVGRGPPRRDAIGRQHHGRPRPFAQVRSVFAGHRHHQVGLGGSLPLECLDARQQRGSVLHGVLLEDGALERVLDVLRAVHQLEGAHAAALAQAVRHGQQPGLLQVQHVHRAGELLQPGDQGFVLHHHLARGEVFHERGGMPAPGLQRSQRQRHVGRPQARVHVDGMAGEEAGLPHVPAARGIALHHMRQADLPAVARMHRRVGTEHQDTQAAHAAGLRAITP